MRITLTRELAGHAIGTTIERNTKVAELLIANGAAIADAADTPKPEADSTSSTSTTNTKAKRTRRSHSRDDATRANAPDKAAGQSVDRAAKEGGGTPLAGSPNTAG